MRVRVLLEFLVVATAACAGRQPSPPPPSLHNAAAARGSASEPLSVAERCAMVEAAFGLPELRTFASAAGARRGRRLLVDVDIEPRFARGEDCASPKFAIYRKGEPTNTDAVLTLWFGARADGTWELGAQFFDPPSSPDDGSASAGGFDDVTYFEAFGGGRLARRPDGTWRVWLDES